MDNLVRKVFVGTWSPFLYVLDLNSETGQITLRNTINVGNSPSWITFNPARTHLYTVNETDTFQNEKNTGGILCYNIDKNTNNLTLINAIKSHGTAPCHLSVDHTNKHIGVANYMGTFSLFAIDATTNS